MQHCPARAARQLAAAALALVLLLALAAPRAHAAALQEKHGIRLRRRPEFRSENSEQWLSGLLPAKEGQGFHVF